MECVAIAAGVALAVFGVVSAVFAGLGVCLGRWWRRERVFVWRPTRLDDEVHARLVSFFRRRPP